MTPARAFESNVCYEVMEITGSAPYLDVLNDLLTSPESSSNEEWQHSLHYHFRGVEPQLLLGHLTKSGTFKDYKF